MNTAAHRLAICLGMMSAWGVTGAAAAEPASIPYKAGVAAKVITPSEPLWMAGYAARDKPAEGKLHDLYVKAVALEDSQGERLVLLTSDLIGIPRELSDAVCAEVSRRAGLSRAQLMLSASHTHCGPVVRENLMDMYNLSPEQAEKIADYTKQLRAAMVEVMLAALADLRPARLSHGQGTARFAVNRRQPTPKGVINGSNPEGPVDHAVPVLAVHSPSGELRAVVFGYACHNTTLGFYQWCGDYAGFAQLALQEKHPGAVALFWAGCGGDANPLPRRTVELCQKYGKELAEAVDGVLAKPRAPIQGKFAARYARVALPFDTLPTRDQLAADLLSKNIAVQRRAKRLLRTLEEGGKLDDHYRHYPVQAWRLGDDVIWIALGGEVVVDYALRLKKELAGRPVWVTAYANDVMAYIPSVRVLKEGGYEADSSMIYYGMPTRWAPPLEEIIVAQVHELVKEMTTK
ncbi:MAG: neutral/alkaline non-lysosomal ceramidase N-terminal domain-containing protein [Gemmataceae bacterium]